MRKTPDVAKHFPRILPFGLQRLQNPVGFRYELHRLIRVQIQKQLHLIRESNIENCTIQLLFFAVALYDIYLIEAAYFIEQGLNHHRIFYQQSHFEILIRFIA
ncbi:hypothetical protein SDC9_167613 [bioreactor metagenome]|uniref:Uncharacterized protein n=1 Tax=bioreactor metagenome TaxID=1076179 RepID=A0A645G0R9_9ZZZZ